MAKAYLFILILGGALTPLAGQAPAPLHLSRAEAIARALDHNPQLTVAREQTAQAKARITEATAFPDPTVSADWSGLTRPFRVGSRTGSDFGIDLTLPFPQKFLLLNRVAGADFERFRFAYVQLRQATASQTVQAYDALLTALRHRDDLTQGATLASDFVAKTQARFEAGTVAKIDVIKAQVDQAQARNALIANDRDVANARAALNRQIGRTLGASIEPTDTLEVPPPVGDLDSMVARAAEMRPELQGLASVRRGAHAAASLAQQYLLPDVGLGVSKNLADGSPDSYTFGVGFSVPLFFWNHQRGQVAEARHRVQELDAAALDLNAQVEQEVRQSWASADAAIKQAIYLRDELLPSAAEAYRIVSVNYGLGGASSLDVLDAKRALLDAERQYTDALGAANDALAQLELAIGTPLTGTTGGPDVR